MSEPDQLSAFHPKSCRPRVLTVSAGTLVLPCGAGLVYGHPVPDAIRLQRGRIKRNWIMLTTAVGYAVQQAQSVYSAETPEQANAGIQAALAERRRHRSPLETLEDLATRADAAAARLRQLEL